MVHFMKRKRLLCTSLAAAVALTLPAQAYSRPMVLAAKPGIVHMNHLDMLNWNHFDVFDFSQMGTQVTAPPFAFGMETAVSVTESGTNSSASTAHSGDVTASAMENTHAVAPEGGSNGSFVAGQGNSPENNANDNTAGSSNHMTDADNGAVNANHSNAETVPDGSAGGSDAAAPSDTEQTTPAGQGEDAAQPDASSETDNQDSTSNTPDTAENPEGTENQTPADENPDTDSTNPEQPTNGDENQQGVEAPPTDAGSNGPEDNANTGTSDTDLPTTEGNPDDKTDESGTGAGTVDTTPAEPPEDAEGDTEATSPDSPGEASEGNTTPSDADEPNSDADKDNSESEQPPIEEPPALEEEPETPVEEELPAELPEEEITEEVDTPEEPIIDVVVPATGSVIINPYRLNVKLGDTMTREQIVNPAQVLTSHSNVPVLVNATATGTISTGSEAVFVSKPPKAEAKEVFMYVEFQQSDDNWIGEYIGAPNQMIITADGSSRDAVMTLDAGIDNPAYGAYRLFGALSGEPDEMWSSADGIEVNVAFTFTPVTGSVD